MKEIEHPEEPVKEDKSTMKQELAERQRRELGDAAATQESPVQTQQAVTKRRSWVWEWSRNNKP